jgi:hypothetical protein
MDMHSPATLRGHYQQDGGSLNGSRSVPLVDGAMAEPSCADQRAAHQRPDDASGPPAADFPPVPARTPRTSWDVIDKVAWSLFARIGWAPPVNCGEDIRTDLATFARDDAAPEDMKRAWDLKAPAHMQVKGSLIEYLSWPIGASASRAGGSTSPIPSSRPPVRSVCRACGPGRHREPGCAVRRERRPLRQADRPRSQGRPWSRPRRAWPFAVRDGVAQDVLGVRGPSSHILRWCRRGHLVPDEDERVDRCGDAGRVGRRGER